MCALRNGAHVSDIDELNSNVIFFYCPFQDEQKKKKPTNKQNQRNVKMYRQTDRHNTRFSICTTFSLFYILVMIRDINRFNANQFRNDYNVFSQTLYLAFGMIPMEIARHKCSMLNV